MPFPEQRRLGARGLYQSLRMNSAISPSLRRDDLRPPDCTISSASGRQHLAHDETYHPFTRTDLKLPSPELATPFHYKEMIEETPAFTTFKLVVRQFL